MKLVNRFTGGTKLDSPARLLAYELRQLYDAELRELELLPALERAASSPELTECIMRDIGRTRHQAGRLADAFHRLGLQPERDVGNAYRGALDDCAAVAGSWGDDSVRDAGIIIALQRVKHLGIAGYGSVRSIARVLGHDEVADLLQTSADEEGAVDRELTELAEHTINQQAVVP